MNNSVELDEWHAQLSLLTQAIQQLHANTESDQFFRLLVKFAVELTAADAGAVGLLQEGEICFIEILDTNQWQKLDSRFGLGEGVAGWVLQKAESFRCHDSQDNPRTVWQKLHIPGVKSLLAVPIMGGREERLLGCLELYNKQSNTDFGARAIAVLQALVASAAGALDNIQRLETHIVKDMQRRKRAEASLRDQQGKVIGLLTTGQDITHRRETEYALRESEARFRGLVESTSDWIWEVDPQGLYTYVSPQVEKILGYSPASLIGKSPFDLMPLVERNRLRMDFFSLAKHQQPISRLVNINTHVSGRAVILETSGVPFYDSYGDFADYRGIDRDITDRKAVEQALKEQTLRNRLILENSHDGLAILNLDGSIREVNAAYCKMLGYERSALLGRYINDLKAPESSTEVEVHIKKIMKYGYDHFESSYRCRDGHVIDLDVSAIFANTGEDRYIFSFARDITERRLKEQVRIQEVQARCDTLVREIHHRIKNHLQGIISLLRNHIQDKPGLTEAMESAISQVESIALVHGLQSRLNQGMIELADLLEMICKAVGHPISAGIQPEVDCPATDIVIRPDDAVPLALIINELLQNAVKHSGPSDVRSSAITASLLADDDYVILQVSNPSAVPLPANFNLQEGVGLGTGLTLARDPLPHQGTELSLTFENDRVTARLILRNPVVSLQRKRGAQDFSVPNRLM